MSPNLQCAQLEENTRLKKYRKIRSVAVAKEHTEYGRMDKNGLDISIEIIPYIANRKRCISLQTTVQILVFLRNLLNRNTFEVLKNIFILYLFNFV